MWRIIFGIGAIAAVASAFWAGQQSGRTSAPPPTAGVEAPLPPLQSSAAEAIARALAIPDRFERVAKLAEVFGELGPAAIEDLRAVYAAGFVEGGDVEYVLLAEWHARHDPKAAFKWAQVNQRGGNAAILATVVWAWAKRDPQGARGAVEAMKFRQTRQATRAALVRGWYESAKPGLVEYLEALPAGQDRQITLAQLTRRMVERAGVDETIRWAESVSGSDPLFKLNVYRRVASALVTADAERAAAWAGKVGDGDYGMGVCRRVAVEWVRRDPLATMSWLEALPAGKSRDAAVQEAYRAWLGSGRDAARQFFAERGMLPWLEPAGILYLTTVAREDPEAALEWLPRFQDLERQREATIKIGRAWRSRDPEAALAWMEQAELPEDVVQRIEERSLSAKAPRQ